MYFIVIFTVMSSISIVFSLNVNIAGPILCLSSLFLPYFMDFMCFQHIRCDKIDSIFTSCNSYSQSLSYSLSKCIRFYWILNEKQIIKKLTLVFALNCSLTINGCLFAFIRMHCPLYFIVFHLLFWYSFSLCSCLR